MQFVMDTPMRVERTLLLKDASGVIQVILDFKNTKRMVIVS